MAVSAVQRLAPSVLSNQLELTADDLDLGELIIKIAGKPGLDIRPFVTGGSVSRTIQGASTVTITLEDIKRAIVNSGYLPADKIVPIQKGRKIHASGYLAKGADILIDGLNFRLKGPRKQGNRLDLLFEDREVALLRTYPRPSAAHNGFKVWPVDKYSRVEVVRELVAEVKETNVRLVCPALAPATVGSTRDRQAQLARQHQRAHGFPAAVDVTVKNAQASPDQLHNLDLILQVGTSDFRARRKVLVVAVMTATQESDAENLKPGQGDRDSVGIFQQRPSQGWGTARDLQSVQYAAAKFFAVALEADRQNPHLGYGELAQLVQASAFPHAYDQWRTEAEHTVSSWGIPGGDGTVDASGQLGLKDGSFQFTRGSKQVINGRTVYTREDNWACLQRLASEVGWRCFCVSGSVYFITDEDLFASAPRMTIDEDSPGVDAIDFDYVEGKKNATVTVACRIGRWDAPPGSVVVVENMGPVDGRWLVDTIERPIFTPDGTITLSKPQPILPESDAPEYALGSGSKLVLGSGLPGGIVDGNAVVAAAKRALASRADYRYEQFRPMPKSLFGPPLPIRIDCSAFATLCYKAAQAEDPNGFAYNGAGNTSTLWANGAATSTPQPGDLVFYGTDARLGGAPGHVVVYIGEGDVISMGGPGDPVQLRVDYRSDLRGYRTYNTPETPAEHHHHRDGNQ